MDNATEDETTISEKAIRMNSYLVSCVMRAKMDNNVDHQQSEAGGAAAASEKPTENTFWRDDEEIFTDNGEDGLSTDYRVRDVYLNIVKTLSLFAECSEFLKDGVVVPNQALMTCLRKLRAKTSERDQPNGRAKCTMIDLKELALAVDTTKTSRRHVVNQMDPLSCCCVSYDRLRYLCRFSKFGEYNTTYGTLQCQFYIPIKLLFLGNLNIKRYGRGGGATTDGGDDRNGQGFTVYDVQIGDCFGRYFEEFLEKLYDVCFDKLQTEFEKYKKDRCLGVQINRHSSYPLRHGELFDRLEELKNSRRIKMLGTTGKMDPDARLRYIRYDNVTRTVTEVEPIETADAVFISSSIAIKINGTGEVLMDVYSRQALLLETLLNYDCLSTEV